MEGTVVDELERLFRREYAPLVRALTVASGDAERAADVVQEAFIQASKHWRRIRRYDEPGAWIRRVAVNRLIDHHRAAKRRHRTVEALTADARTAAAADGSDRSPDQAASLDLERALRALPRGQRLAVCLHYLADLPVAEVAALLEIAPGTVKSQLHDARARLLQLLEVRDDT